MFRIPAAVAATFGVLAFTLSACGMSDSAAEDDLRSLSADALYAKAQEELAAAPAFTVIGDFGDEPRQVEVDLTYEPSGDMYGTVIIDGARGEMRSIDGGYFVKGTDQYWATSGAGAGLSADLIAAIQKSARGKWISFGSSGKDGLEKIDRKRMLELVGAGDDVSKGKHEIIDGVDCLTLNNQDWTIFVDAKSGRPVRLDFGDGKPIRIAYYRATSPGAPDGAIDVKDFGG